MSRCFLVLAIVLSACAVAEADDTSPQIVEVDASTVQFPARIIEVSRSLVMRDGIRVYYSPETATCAVQTEIGLDFAGCCPQGWHLLALTPAETPLCEEDL